jgi:hypothetical protein
MIWGEWTMLGFGRSLMIQGICRKTLTPRWTWHGKVHLSLPCFWHRWVLYIGYDPAGGVFCQEVCNLPAHSLDTPTKQKLAARNDAGGYTLGNMELMLLKLVNNAWGFHLHRHHCDIRSWRCGCVARFNISKKLFRLGGLAPWEWTRSVRAVRDTPVAADTAPGVNTTRSIGCHPPITALPFLLALSVSYFKRTLWHWRPTVTIPQNEFIRHAVQSGLQFDGWPCENLSLHSFYLHTIGTSIFINYTHHFKLPDLCGYWESIPCSVRHLSYYQ